jgi:structural maintenance of chromosome 2
VVAKLTRVADPSTATALEVAAGGKLYQVVVDSDATAKALLAHGQLRQRVTIIPLNKVSARDIPAPAVAAARRLGGGKAQPALELVGFDQELSAAMKYVFGGAFVCQVRRWCWVRKAWGGSSSRHICCTTLSRLSGVWDNCI